MDQCSVQGAKTMKRRIFDAEEVSGSNPLSPTTINPRSERRLACVLGRLETDFYIVLVLHALT